MPSGNSFIFMTSPTICMSWIWAPVLISAVALTRRSSSLPLLVMIMKPEATSAAPGAWRDQGWWITRLPNLISCASPAAIPMIEARVRAEANAI